jgi:hypothetical protein
VEEEEVEMEVFAIDNHAFLALDKGKTATEFEDEALQLMEDGGFQIVFIVAGRQAEEF